MAIEFKVSIIIPVYNAESYLRDAIESALSQEGVNIEVIVVDDGSTDSSRSIALNYKEVMLIQQRNKGACRARNVGLQNATGDFVKFLDADDFLERNSIASQVNFMQELHERAVVYSDLRYFDHETNMSRMQCVEIPESSDHVHELLKINIQTSAPLHRRRALLEIGGFDERLTRAQEYNLHLRLAIAGYRFQRLPGITAHVREHNSPSRITNQIRDSVFQDNEKLRTRIYCELLREYYGSVIPAEIRRHYVSNGIEAALTRIRHCNIDDARATMVMTIQFGPSVWDFLVGGAIAVRRVVLGKLRRGSARSTAPPPQT